MIGASKATTTRAYQVLSTTTITSTGSQNYTVPEGTLFLEIEMYGSGGGGGAGVEQGGGRGGSTHFRGGGGGGGSYVKHKIFSTNVVKDATINFTVGAGGAGSASSNGANGADTTLNTIVSPGGGSVVDISGPVAAAGERGFVGASLNTNGSDGGVAANGNITNTNGNDGEDANTQFSSSGSALNGGNGGAPGGPDIVTVNTGAGASTSSAAQVGRNGGGGGGGGASTTNRGGANGANGIVIVKAYG